VSTIRERPVQRYSEVFGLGAEGQGFVAEADSQLIFASLLLRWKTADTVFVVLSFILFDDAVLVLINHSLGKLRSSVDCEMTKAIDWLTANKLPLNQWFSTFFMQQPSK